VLRPAASAASSVLRHLRGPALGCFGIVMMGPKWSNLARNAARRVSPTNDSLSRPSH
jgi:hypothetical protein